MRVNSIEIILPDSVKQGLAAEFASSLMNSPLVMSANAFASPAMSLSGSTCGGDGTAPVYTMSRVAFDPEPIPNVIPYPVYDDGIMTDDSVRLGFNFTFYGKTYDRVNVYSNGLLLFGPLPSLTLGFPKAGYLPSSTANPKNIIAFAWTDWQPNMVSDPIRFETRGTAPRRRFIIQFNNVPEYAAANKFNDIKTLGGLMTQIVLSEGTNDITIYTNKLKVVNTSHLVTQGIENADGTDAKFDSVLHVSGVWIPRRQAFFNLSNDAVRFSPVQTADNEPPVITSPGDKTANNDPGLASAVVAVGSPIASDNCQLESVTSLRSDGAALNAPYPVGVTTITWTAKDVSGNIATATQSITVIDWEAPSLTAPADYTVDATSPSGVIVFFSLESHDNVAVSSLACTPLSGSRLPIGDNPITCTAYDAAGNHTSASFVVSVTNAPIQTRNLIAEIQALGLSDGLAYPLINQLLAALDGDGNACKKMDDFLDLLSKKGGAEISAEEMASFRNEAIRICNVMDCPPSAKRGAKPQLSPSGT